MSVIGAITYELPAATTTANALGITALSETITDPQVYTAIAWVMTLGIFPGLIWVPLFIKKIQGGLMKIKNKDSKWGDILMTALFLGMISAFLGMVFADIRSGLAGWIFVLLFSRARHGNLRAPREEMRYEMAGKLCTSHQHALCDGVCCGDHAADRVSLKEV